MPRVCLLLLWLCLVIGVPGFSICDGCVAPELVFSSGFAIDFSFNYATIAAQRQDGSKVSLARVDATEDYKGLMLRLLSDAEVSRSLVAAGKSIKPRAIYPEPWRRRLVQPERQMRSILRPDCSMLAILSGLDYLIQWIARKPIDEVGHHDIAGCQGALQLLEPQIMTINGMVEQLKVFAGDALQTSPQFVGISQPLALSQSHTWLFTAAMQQANMTVISQGWDRDTSTVFAAPAAYGMGMCEHYRRPSTCSEEHMAMKSEILLVIEFTSPVFSAQILWSFQGLLNPRDEDFIYSSTDLGQSSRWRSDVGDEAYWSELSARLRNLIETSLMFPTKVIFVGDHAADQHLVHTVRDCLGAMRPYDVVDLVVNGVVDPVFVASLGAAKIVKREMESPGGCIESRECYSWRGEDTS